MHEVRNRKRRIIALVSVLDGKLVDVMFRDGCDTFENRELVRSKLKALGV
jgi:hypothetical protein